MILITKNIEYKYNLLSYIEHLDKNAETDLLIEEDVRNYKHYDKCQYIITEYHAENINYFLNLNKQVILCTFHKEKVKKRFLNHKNIQICNNIEEVKEFLKTKRMAAKKRPFMVLLLLLLLLLGTAAFYVTKDFHLSQKEKSTDTVDKKNQDYSEENYVFLGDSITDFYPLDTYYENMPVVNSGVSGNTTEDILRDMRNRVYQYNPTKVYVLIGTNDISDERLSEDEIANNIIKICDLIRQNRPSTEIYIESIYPVNRNTENDLVDIRMVSSRKNSEIEKINQKVKEQAEEKNYHYLDIYSKLIDEENNLKLEYTVDGLHISDKGYEVITQEIKKTMN